MLLDLFVFSVLGETIHIAESFPGFWLNDDLVAYLWLLNSNIGKQMALAKFAVIGNSLHVRVETVSIDKI